jgi:hypothetical protein
MVSVWVLTEVEQQEQSKVSLVVNLGMTSAL